MSSGYSKFVTDTVPRECPHCFCRGMLMRETVEGESGFAWYFLHHDSGTCSYEPNDYDPKPSADRMKVLSTIPQDAEGFAVMTLDGEWEILS